MNTRREMKVLWCVEAKWPQAPPTKLSLKHHTDEIRRYRLRQDIRSRLLHTTQSYTRYIINFTNIPEKRNKKNIKTRGKAFHRHPPPPKWVCFSPTSTRPISFPDMYSCFYIRRTFRRVLEMMWLCGKSHNSPWLIIFSPIFFPLTYIFEIPYHSLRWWFSTKPQTIY